MLLFHLFVCITPWTWDMVSPWYLPCFSLISLASASRSSGEAASAEPDWGPRASGTLHASAVLPGCPFLQPGEEGNEYWRRRGFHWQVLNTCKCQGFLCFEGQFVPFLSPIFIFGKDPLLDLWPAPETSFHWELCFLSVSNRHGNRKRCWNRGTTFGRNQLGYCPHDQVTETKIIKEKIGGRRVGRPCGLH